MNCENVQRLLNDYVDNLLREKEIAEIETHLSRCGTCSREADRLRGLLDSAASLPTSIQPPRDLWPGVVGRLSPGAGSTRLSSGESLRRFPSRRSLFAAAAVIVAVIATAVTTTIIHNRRSIDVPVYESGHGDVYRLASMPQDYRSAALEYREVADNLLEMLEVRRQNLSPETLTIIDENRRIIDRAIFEIEKALEKDPGSRELGTRLLVAYQQEVELLRRATMIPVQL